MDAPEAVITDVAEEFHMRTAVLVPRMIAPYESSPVDLVLSAYGEPEYSDNVEPVHVVGAPPTLLVKVPPTARVAPDASVKLVAAAIVVSCVEVALPVMVQPPAALLKMRL
jgi:hypothetical protein